MLCRIRIRTSDYILIRIRKALKHADPDPQDCGHEAPLSFFIKLQFTSPVASIKDVQAP
jgi:hypothetical protein